MGGPTTGVGTGVGIGDIHRQNQPTQPFGNAGGSTRYGESGSGIASQLHGNNMDNRAGNFGNVTYSGAPRAGGSGDLTEREAAALGAQWDQVIMQTAERLERSRRATAAQDEHSSRSTNQPAAPVSGSGTAAAAQMMNRLSAFGPANPTGIGSTNRLANFGPAGTTQMGGTRGNQSAMDIANAWGDRVQAIADTPEVIEAQIGQLSGLDFNNPEACLSRLILFATLRDFTDNYLQDELKTTQRVHRIFQLIHNLRREEDVAGDQLYGSRTNRLTAHFILALTSTEPDFNTSEATKNLSEAYTCYHPRIIDMMLPLLLNKYAGHLRDLSRVPRRTQYFFEQCQTKLSNHLRAVTQHRNLLTWDDAQPVREPPMLQPCMTHHLHTDPARPAMYIMAPKRVMENLLSLVHQALSPSLQQKLHVNSYGSPRIFQYSQVQPQNVSRPSDFHEFVAQAADRNANFILMPWSSVEQIFNAQLIALPRDAETLASGNMFHNVYLISPQYIRIHQEPDFTNFELNLCNLGACNAFEFFDLRDKIMFTNENNLLRDIGPSSRDFGSGNQVNYLLFQRMQEETRINDEESILSSIGQPNRKRLSFFGEPAQQLKAFRDDHEPGPGGGGAGQGPSGRMTSRFGDQPFGQSNQSTWRGQGQGQYRPPQGGNGRNYYSSLQEQEHPTPQDGEHFDNLALRGREQDRQQVTRQETQEEPPEPNQPHEGCQPEVNQNDTTISASTAPKQESADLSPMLPTILAFTQLASLMQNISQPIGSFGSHAAFLRSNLTTSDPRYEGPLSGFVSSSNVDNGTTTVGDQVELRVANAVQFNDVLSAASQPVPTSNSNTDTCAASQPLSQNDTTNSAQPAVSESSSSTLSGFPKQDEFIFPWGNTAPMHLWVIGQIALEWARRYFTISNPDPQCHKIVQATFTAETIQRLEGLAPNTPFRMPYEVFDYLMALDIANIHAVSVKSKPLPDKAAVKAAIKAERQANAYTKPHIMQSKKSHKRNARRERGKRQSRTGHYSSSSSEDDDDDDSNWDQQEGRVRFEADEESDESNGEERENEPQKETPVYASYGATSNSHDLNLDTPDGVLALVTQNTSYNTDVAKVEEFMEWTHTRDYDESKGHYRNSTVHSPINKTTGITTALRLLRHSYEAQGKTPFAFMTHLAQGNPFAKPADFVPPIPDD